MTPKNRIVRMLLGFITHPVMVKFSGSPRFLKIDAKTRPFVPFSQKQRAQNREIPPTFRVYNRTERLKPTVF